MYTRNQARAQSWVHDMHFFKLGSAGKSQKKIRKKIKKKSKKFSKISSINPELSVKKWHKKMPRQMVSLAGQFLLFLVSFNSYANCC